MLENLYVLLEYNVTAAVAAAFLLMYNGDVSYKLRAFTL
jgi:hypothetical protein